MSTPLPSPAGQNEDVKSIFISFVRAFLFYEDAYPLFVVLTRFT